MLVVWLVESSCEGVEVVMGNGRHTSKSMLCISEKIGVVRDANVLLYRTIADVRSLRCSWYTRTTMRKITADDD